MKRRSPRCPTPKQTSQVNDLIKEQLGRVQDVIDSDYSIISVDNNREDAACFNKAQLQFIANNQPQQFEGFDFLHVLDDTISQVFGYKPMEFPFTVCCNEKDIKFYRRETSKARSS